MVKEAYGSQGKNLAIGADILVKAALSDQFTGMTGRYFADSNEAIPSRFGQDDALASALWTRSEDIVSQLDEMCVNP